MRPTTRRYLVIVPAFNEAGAITATVAELHALAPEFDVLVVDDGSSDRTAERARAAGAQVISHCFNLGIGGAVQSGYQYAFEHDYEVAVQVDGDGQHDPRYIGALLDELHATPGVNVVTGSRFLRRTPGSFRSSAPRRAGIRVFSTLLSALVGRRITDPTSGFRMCDRWAIELFARDYPHDYPEVESVLLAHANLLTGAEIAVTMRARSSGASSIHAAHSLLYMSKVTLSILIGLLRARPAAAVGHLSPVEPVV